MDYDGICFTNFETRRASFRWKLGRFSVYLNEKSSPPASITSDSFPCGAVQCSLTIEFPSPRTYLHTRPQKSATVSVKLNVTEKVFQYVLFIELEPSSKLKTLRSDNVSLCVPVQTLTGPSKNDYLPNDVLTIACDVTSHEFANRSNQTWVRVQHDQEAKDRTVQEDLHTLLQSGEHSDVTFVVGESQRELKAHKQVLSARSPVFSAMFQHKTEESRSSSVKIADAEFEVLLISRIANIDLLVVQEMLQFIYTDKAPHLKTMVKELFALSDKYCLQKLKALCSNELQHALNPGNAMETLVLADRYNASGLKASCLQFIACRCSQLGTDFLDGHRDLQERDPKLFAKICKATWSCASTSTY